VITTAIRLFATTIGYMVMIMWLLGAFDLADFTVTFKVV